MDYDGNGQSLYMVENDRLDEFDLLVCGNAWGIWFPMTGESPALPPGYFWYHMSYHLTRFSRVKTGYYECADKAQERLELNQCDHSMIGDPFYRRMKLLAEELYDILCTLAPKIPKQQETKASRDAYVKFIDDCFWIADHHERMQEVSRDEVWLYFPGDPDVDPDV
jgi:hypothetical protein